MIIIQAKRIAAPKVLGNVETDLLGCFFSDKSSCAISFWSHESRRCKSTASSVGIGSDMASSMPFSSARSRICPRRWSHVSCAVLGFVNYIT